MTGRRDPATPCSGGLRALLALVLLGTFSPRTPAQGTDASPVSATVPTATAPHNSLNPLSTLDPTTLGGFKERPLFAPSRRAPPPRQAVIALPAPVAIETPPPDLRLVGVVAGADKALAILRRPAGGASLNLKVGDTVDTWRVEAIGPDRVSLREGAREKTYRLFSVGGAPEPLPASRITNLPQIGIPGPR